MKTYKEWRGSISDYLKVGDIVDKEMVEHFINCYPPITLNGLLVQCGEAYDTRNGKNTYITFAKENGHWMYKGDCNRNCTE